MSNKNQVVIGNFPTSECRKQQQQQQEEARESKFMRFGRRIPAFGIILCIIVAFFYNFSMASVKLAESINGHQLLLLRSSAQVVIAIAFVTLSGRDRTTSIMDKLLPNNGERSLVLLRALMASANLILAYVCVKMISLSDLVTIKFTQCIWTLMLSRCLGRESCSFYKIVALLLSLTGVLTISHPELVHSLIGLDSSTDVDIIDVEIEYNSSVSFAMRASDYLDDYKQNNDQQMIDDEISMISDAQSSLMTTRFIGCCLAILLALANAISMIIVKSLQRTPVSIVWLWSMMANVVFSASLLTITEGFALPDNTFDWLMVLANFLITSITNVLFIYSIKFENPGVISVVRTVEIVIAYVIGEFLLGESATITEIVGSTFVMSGALLMLLMRLYQSGAFNRSSSNSNSTLDSDDNTSMRSSDKNLQTPNGRPNSN